MTGVGGVGGVGVEVVRAGAVVPLALLGAGIVAVRPDPRRLGAIGLSTLWSLVALTAVNLVAVEAGWWTFDVRGGQLGPIPADLLLAWAVAWGGAVPLVDQLGRRGATVGLIAGLVAFDLVAMPQLAPVVELGRWWLVGEVVAVVAVVPGWWLARATVAEGRLRARVVAQVILFTGFGLWFLPYVTLSVADRSVEVPTVRPRWLVAVVIVAVPLVSLGMAAVIELAMAAGTPFPWDPPNRLVVTGPYAYLANPMQVAAVGLVLVEAAVLGEWLLVAVAVGAAAFSSGLAELHERGALGRRFGPPYERYRSEVRPWVPRVRPTELLPPARLWLSAGCDTCATVGRFLHRRAPSTLALHRAEDSPVTLVRAGYDDADGRQGRGVGALALAADHLGLGWAVIGWWFRLPLFDRLVQLCFDVAVPGPGPVGGGGSGTDPDGLTAPG